MFHLKNTAMQKKLLASFITVFAAVSTHSVEKSNGDSKESIFKFRFRPAMTMSQCATNADSKINTLSKESMLLIGGSAHPALTAAVAEQLNIDRGSASMSRFADGECKVQINDNVRGRDVFILQTCAAPVNDSIMELLMTISAVRRSGASRVIAVIPYFGYKHHRRGLPVHTKVDSLFLSSNARDFAKMLTHLGVDRVISVDLQRPGQGGEASFFDNDVPLETLITTKLMTSKLIDYFRDSPRDIVVVAPNAESLQKARKYQSALEKNLQKTITLKGFFQAHYGSGPSNPSKLISLNLTATDFRDKDVIIIDDIIDTGGTISELATRMKELGASGIYVCASHGIFVQNALELIETGPIRKVWVTDSLPLPLQKPLRKIEVVTIAPHLSDLIRVDYMRSNQAIFNTDDDNDDGDVEISVE